MKTIAILGTENICQSVLEQREILSLDPSKWKAIAKLFHDYIRQ